jgi:hypothetical protein
LIIDKKSYSEEGPGVTNLSDATTFAAAGSPRLQVRPRGRFRISLLLAGAVLFVAWYATERGYYTPASDLGYYIGVVGGSMLLTLLLYPLRKHVRFLAPLGAIKHWFKLHMVLGIGGPMLVIIHSGFHIGSLNAAVAMLCMLLVAGSGVIGRFIYTRIHHGLYGRKATVQDMRQRLGIQTSEVRSKFHFAPEAEARLEAFGEFADRHPSNAWAASWHFMTLGLRARQVRHQCRREVQRKINAHAARRHWSRAKLRQRTRAADTMIRNYLDVVQNAAQFHAYERLFSLWHIAHVPFVFMLVGSGIVHVIAVHMY